jgi:hypothetical protein
MMRGDLLGVARSSRIHEIYGGEEDEHEEHDKHDEHDTQIEGKHQEETPRVESPVGPIHKLNRITRKRLQE